MVRDMRRFLEQLNFKVPLTEFFGGDVWRACADAADRECCLLLRFSQTVRERGIARFATPFRVMEDERRQRAQHEAGHAAAALRQEGHSPDRRAARFAAASR